MGERESARKGRLQRPRVTVPRDLVGEDANAPLISAPYDRMKIEGCSLFLISFHIVNILLFFKVQFII